MTPDEQLAPVADLAETNGQPERMTPADAVASVILHGGLVAAEVRVAFATFTAGERHRTIIGLTDGGYEAAARVLASPSAGGGPIDAADLLAEAADDQDFDWLVPGLIERGDRIIVTGEEGGGKSTFLRVVGLRLACGLHPFGDRQLDPLRVLLVDVENTRRQTRRALRRLWPAAREHYRSGHYLVVLRPDGVDLASRADRAALADVVETTRPDLIVVGPLYKLTGGDPVKEEPARVASDALAALRDIGGAALLIEAHTPHAGDRAERPKRPYGASLWLRWPEFGLHLAADGTVTHWRGPRDERQWPHKLRRGGPWLWELDPDPGVRARDAVLALLESSAVPLVGHAIVTAVGGRQGEVRKALADLVTDPASGVRSRPKAGKGGGLVYWLEATP